MTWRFSTTQQLRYAGLFTWACLGIPMIWEPWYFDERGGLGRLDLLAWRVSYFVFGLCYWLITQRLDIRSFRRPVEIWLLLVLTAAAIGVSYFSESGLGSILLMLVAGVLPWLLPMRIGVGWLVLQHSALVPVFARVPDYQPLDAVLQAALYVGVSSFVFVTSFVARQQAEAREEQRRLNAELRATRALLAESSRLTERMRISRELHDLLGHHLTALSLNLEVASHLSSGRAQENVRQAQSLARLLLSDVREAVSQLRGDDALDLREALERLVEGVPGLEVELDLPAGVRIEDPARAQVVLRCAQEIITNTVRHSGARRLAIVVDGDDDGGVRVRASDDGRGADAPDLGNGLRGMRERLAQFGGTMRIDTARGRGFSLELWLPPAETVPTGGE
jgi:signal transduction histidine kinase